VNLAFGNSMLLWGMGLAAVPIVIHLFNRRRFVVQPFAAMAFLQQAFASRRRRVRMENLLLLLLRCLVVLLAALAMALPSVSSGSPLAMFSGGRRDVVLIIDRSGSTERRLPGGGSIGERALDQVRRRISGLSDEQGDAVTLIIPGSADHLPAPIGATPSVALAALDRGLPPSEGVADLVQAVRLVRDRVRPVRPGQLDIELYTDLQELSWREHVGQLFREIFDDGGGSLRIIDLAADIQKTNNLGVESVSVAESLVLASRPITVLAVVRNHSGSTRLGVVGSFSLDGELKRTIQDIEIPPRGSTVVSMRLRIDTPGPHHVTFALEPDELTFDDARSLALSVRDQIDVLLVDGMYSPSRLDRSTGYLELALDPSAGMGSDDVLTSGFAAEVVDTRTFEGLDRELFEYDAIVLADVGGLGAETAERLAQVVKSGTPLLIFTGPSVVPLLYAEELATRGLLPATVGAPQGDEAGEADYVSLVLADPPPPSLKMFADPRLAVLLQVPVLRWNELVPLDGARVMAWFADALGNTTPAIVESELGLGRVVLVGTTANDEWSLLPRHPATWVPLVHELLSGLIRVDPGMHNVPLGQSPTLVVDGVPIRARLELSSGAMEVISAPDYEPMGERSLLSLAATPLIEPGPAFLTVETGDSARIPERLALAALPDFREGDLRRIDTMALAERLQGVDFVVGEAVAGGTGGPGGDSGNGSLFRALLWALLVVACGESLLARFVGGSR
jgi:hypothetical protein